MPELLLARNGGLGLSVSTYVGFVYLNMDDQEIMGTRQIFFILPVFFLSIYNLEID